MINIKNKKNQILILGAVFVILVVIAIVLIIRANATKETSQNNIETGNIENTEEDTNHEEIIEEEVPEGLIDEVQEEEEPEPKPEKPNTNTTTSKTPKYYIKVNYGANVVTIYTKDEKGNYTTPYKAMLCSTGTATFTGGTYTIPSGKWDRWPWGQMVGGVWAQYYVRIKGSILFHSVPYVEKNKSTLEYWEYDKLGTKASAGCIRLTVQDAKWIYDNCEPGTKVEFYTDSNPGPLGKPSAQKISSDEPVRGWDPTDPDKNNPWKNYTRPETNSTTQQQPATEPEDPWKDNEGPILDTRD